MPSINWQRFPNNYRKSDTHWYVSKIKTYSPESLEQLATGLKLLNKWFVDAELLTGKEAKAVISFQQSSQSRMFEDRSSLKLRWTPVTELYYAYLLDKERIISERNRPPKILEKYAEIFKQIEAGKTYDWIRQRYRKRILFDIAANARNFISIYQKLGFAWVQEERSVTISSTGKQFMEGNIDRRVVMEHQAGKWQLYNPTLPKRYRSLKIFPYLFLLRLFLKLDLPGISKKEYALFVTKARTMDELQDVNLQISEFRGLPKEKRDAIYSELEKSEKGRTRSIFIELLDSATKELGFFTAFGPLESKTIDGAQGISLKDRDRAKEILAAIGNPVFIEFDNELDWFNYFGDWKKGPTIDDAINYYAEIGQIEKVKKLAAESAQDVKDKAESVMKEKDIEYWFLDRLGMVEKNLRLYRTAELTGQQYPTEIGRIDILAIDGDGNFVIIEFKKDQSSDETVGQLLRYMGWVHVNLAKGEVVRGIIIASEIDDKTQYALIGTQHPKRDRLFSVYRHLGIEKISIKSK